MAVQSIYQRYADRASRAGINRGTKESIDWFRKTIRKDRKINTIEKAQAGLSNVTKPVLGGLYVYEYDPKHRDKLQYYDTFPLVLFLENIDSKSFYGLNLHYLPPTVRARLLADFWLGRSSGVRTAKAIGTSRFGKAALRRYIYRQIRSRIKRVPQEDWEIAVSLPFENFKGISNTQVWRKAR